MEKYYERYLYARNYACRIKEYEVNGMRCLSMENEKIKVAILVDKGTDIYEFVYKPQDLDVLFHSFNGIRNMYRTVPTIHNPRGPFIDFYEGGWQELLPNIGHPCTYKSAALGNNGEVATMAWDYTITKDTPDEIEVVFRVRTMRLPLYVEKTLSLKSGESTLSINETVTNEGNVEVDFMWGMHPAFGPDFLDDSCYIEVPEGCKVKVPFVDNGPNSQLVRDSYFDFPYGKYNDGTIVDVSKVPPIEENVYNTFYIYDIPEGWYRLTSNNKKVSFQLEWDRDVCPILWFWGCYGGALDYPWFGRNYNLAMEPWSAVPRNLEEVIRRGQSLKLKPGASMDQWYKASIIDHRQAD